MVKLKVHPLRIGAARMRFGLASLFFFMLFVSSLSMVICLSNAWNSVRTVSGLSEDAIISRYPIPWNKPMSDDLSRRLVELRPLVRSTGIGWRGVAISDAMDSEKLLFILSEQPIAVAYFLTDDRINVVTEMSDNDFSSWQFVEYHRRFPEWWWGHFYRPEVWLAIIFGVLWFWRVTKWFQEQRAGGRDQVAHGK